MTNFRKLTTGAAILSVAALMSTSTFAMDDMSCGDFNALSPDDQMATVHEMNGGCDEAHEKAHGDDDATTDSANAPVAVGTEADMTNTNAEGGKDAAQDKMRADDDMLVAVTKYCSGDDALMLGDMRHPSDSEKSKSE